MQTSPGSAAAPATAGAGSSLPQFPSLSISQTNHSSNITQNYYGGGCSPEGHRRASVGGAQTQPQQGGAAAATNDGAAAATNDSATAPTNDSAALSAVNDDNVEENDSDIYVEDGPKPVGSESFSRGWSEALAKIKGASTRSNQARTFSVDAHRRLVRLRIQYDNLFLKVNGNTEHTTQSLWTKIARHMHQEGYRLYEIKQQVVREFTGEDVRRHYNRTVSVYKAYRDTYTTQSGRAGPAFAPLPAKIAVLDKESQDYLVASDAGYKMGLEAIPRRQRRPTKRHREQQVDVSGPSTGDPDTIEDCSAASSGTPTPKKKARSDLADRAGSRRDQSPATSLTSFLMETMSVQKTRIEASARDRDLREAKQAARTAVLKDALKHVAQCRDGPALKVLVHATSALAVLDPPVGYLTLYEMCLGDGEQLDLEEFVKLWANVAQS